MSRENPMVSVILTTYGHEAYIKEAISGVLIQICDFEVELIIANDCSPDHTDSVVQNIINTEPKALWIKYINHKTNKGMMPNFLWALEQCKGKYIAFCDGDDYWTDPYKLQKQVDFLDNNLDYGLIYTRSINFNQLTKKFYNNNLFSKVNSFNELIESNKISTLTVLLKKDLVVSYFNEISPEKEKWLMGDYPMWLFASLKSKIHFHDEVTGVYRVLEESASNTNDIKKRELFIISTFKIKLFFLEYCGEPFDKIRLSDQMNMTLCSNAINYSHITLALTYFKRVKNLYLKIKLIKKGLIYCIRFVFQYLKNLNGS